MKVLLPFLFFVFSTALFAQEKANQTMSHRGVKNCEGGPWLGIHVVRMERATAAQLHEVPEGFGLLVDSVDGDSPASIAGLQAMDVIWKFDDQLLANKGQLFALMWRVGVGSECLVTVSRRGENLVLPVTIGPRPHGGRELAETASEVLMPPLPGAVFRQLDLGKRSGFISEGGVTVSLVKNVDGFDYSVSEGEEVIKEGVLPGRDTEVWPETLDEKTRRKLQVLLDSLKNAEQRDSSGIQRKPRVRRVPTPSTSNKK